MDLHFASAWEAVADACPEATAIVQGDRRISYAAYDDRAARFAGAMEAAGLGLGTKVSLYLYNSPEYLIAQHGAFKAGACR
nr:AMP-binding protein [Actinomarinicola tropica]